MRCVCMLLILWFVAGCQHATSDEEALQFDYPHSVVRVDVARLLSGDLRYNVELRDGDVLVPSNDAIFEGKLDAAGNLKTDRVSAERPLPARYEVKPGDLLLVSIYELREPGVDEPQHCRVDGRGWIRLDHVGPFDAKGSSPAELERAIAKRLEDAIILRDPTVTVQVLEAQWSVRVHAPKTPRPSTYSIHQPIRVMQAFAWEGLQGVEDYRYVYIVRRVQGQQAANDGSAQ